MLRVLVWHPVVLPVAVEVASAIMLPARLCACARCGGWRSVTAPRRQACTLHTPAWCFFARCHCSSWEACGCACGCGAPFDKLRACGVAATQHIQACLRRLQQCRHVLARGNSPPVGLAPACTRQSVTHVCVRVCACRGCECMYKACCGCLYTRQAPCPAFQRQHAVAILCACAECGSQPASSPHTSMLPLAHSSDAQMANPC
jgi:hypothetical protein